MTEVRAVGVLTAEQATSTKQGLEVAKVRQAEIKATLQKSLADIEVGLQSSLETPETEQKALESEQKARSRVD